MLCVTFREGSRYAVCDVLCMQCEHSVLASGGGGGGTRLFLLSKGGRHDKSTRGEEEEAPG